MNTNLPLSFEDAAKNLSIYEKMKEDQSIKTLYIGFDRFYLINSNPSNESSFSTRLFARISNIFIRCAGFLGVLEKMTKGVPTTAKVCLLINSIYTSSLEKLDQQQKLHEGKL